MRRGLSAPGRVGTPDLFNQGADRHDLVRMHKQYGQQLAWFSGGGSAVLLSVDRAECSQDLELDHRLDPLLSSSPILQTTYPAIPVAARSPPSASLADSRSPSGSEWTTSAAQLT